MKNIMISIIGVLFFAGMADAALVPKFTISPKDTVEVGEEMMFSATSTTYADNPALLRKARYEWDFGDGYAFKFGSPLPFLQCSGIAVVHYFMKPGTFSVKLTVSVYSSFAADGTPQGTPVIGSYSSVVTVTGETPISGFSLLHASFTAHLAQYIYATIPPDYQGNQTSLRITLIGTNTNTATLLTKSNLSSEEKFLFSQRTLIQGNYVLVAELLGSDGVRLPGGIWREKISKPYAGVPKVGIDENNAFCVNGKLFFPIGPYMTDPGTAIIRNIDSADITALHTEGYYPTHTTSTWTDYITQASSYNLMCMGPTRGNYSWGEDPANPYCQRFNHDVDSMVKYVVSTRDKTSMMMWSWDDEPNMGGWSTKVYAPVQAAWQYVSHINDPQHPVGNGLYLFDWLKYYGSTYCSLFDYMTSDNFFGGKKWGQDVLGGDIYPLEGRFHVSLNYTDMGPVAAYLDGIDRLMTNNKMLMPFLPYVQPCKEQPTDTLPAPTADQVTMQAWLNVIHGAKGILWFEYFDQSTMRWDAMGKFAKQVLPLAPIVLGPPSTRTITNDAKVALKRVDIMSRDVDSTTVYLFAARVTEPDPVSAAKYKGIEPKNIVAHFSVSGFTGTYPTQVLYENNRMITTVNGQFSDTFAQNAVHIYRVSTTISGIKEDLKKKDMLSGLDWTFRRNAGEWTVTYRLPQGVRSELTMYNVRGQMVRVLAVTHEGTNSYLARVPLANFSKGVYFFRLKSDEFAVVKKMEFIQ